MRTWPADRQRNRKWSSAPACTAYSLLIVEALRGHVPQQNRLQRSYVYSSLHGRGNRQHVDLVWSRRLSLNEDALEQGLTQLTRLAFGLPSQFLGMETSYGSRASGETREVIITQVNGMCIGLHGKWLATMLTHTGIAVQVDPRASVAAPNRAAAGAHHKPVHGQKPAGRHLIIVGQTELRPFDKLFRILPVQPSDGVQPSPQSFRRRI
jgi:hypothetical protein